MNGNNFDLCNRHLIQLNRGLYVTVSVRCILWRWWGQRRRNVWRQWPLWKRSIKYTPRRCGKKLGFMHFQHKCIPHQDFTSNIGSSCRLRLSLQASTSTYISICRIYQRIYQSQYHGGRHNLKLQIQMEDTITQITASNQHAVCKNTQRRYFAVTIASFKLRLGFPIPSSNTAPRLGLTHNLQELWERLHDQRSKLIKN